MQLIVLNVVVSMTLVGREVLRYKTYRTQSTPTSYEYRTEKVEDKRQDTSGSHASYVISSNTGSGYYVTKDIYNRLEIGDDIVIETGYNIDGGLTDMIVKPIRRD